MRAEDRNQGTRARAVTSTPQLLRIPSRTVVRHSPVRTPRLVMPPVEADDGPDLWEAIDSCRRYLEPWLPWVPFNDSPEASQLCGSVRGGLGFRACRALRPTRPCYVDAARCRGARFVCPLASLVRARLLAPAKRLGSRSHDRSGTGLRRVCLPENGRSSCSMRRCDGQPSELTRDRSAGLSLRRHRAASRVRGRSLAGPRGLRSVGDRRLGRV